jgi:acetyl esterase/lipase
MTSRPEWLEVRTLYGGAPAQFVEWTLPQKPSRPALLIAIHGGYWRARYGLDRLRPFCQAFCRLGFAVASLEYRRLGEDGGGWPGTLEDVQLALSSLPATARAEGLKFSKAVLVGHSAGGQLALWAPSSARTATSAQLPVAGVVGLAAVSDLKEAARLNLSKGAVRELLGGGPETVPERYRSASPVERLPLGIPTVLLHGTRDEDVPYALSPAYVEKARAAGDVVRLVTLEGAGHFDVIQPESRHWPEVVAAVESVG